MVVTPHRPEEGSSSSFDGGAPQASRSTASEMPIETFAHAGQSIEPVPDDSSRAGEDVNELPSTKVRQSTGLAHRVTLEAYVLTIWITPYPVPDFAE